MELIYFQSPPEEPCVGEFEVRDLMPGMGTVVGTALRRVLLSSVPGTAAVWMRIDGVLHEFSTIPGVREDVCELALRMKKLRFRVYDRGIHILTLDVRGRDVMAADLVTDGGVEVLNPLCRIATMNETGHLKMELMVQTGRDHTPEQLEPGLREAETKPVNGIWLDPVYSPVEQVAVDVEEDGEWEHLRLRVRTNGVVSPRQAVDWAGRILEGLMSAVQTVAEPAGGKVQMVLGVSESALEELGLSVRSYNRLRRAHFQTVEDVLNCSRQDLYDTKELGPKTIMELEEKLGARGLCLRS